MQLPSQRAFAEVGDIDARLAVLAAEARQLTRKRNSPAEGRVGRAKYDGLLAKIENETVALAAKRGVRLLEAQQAAKREAELVQEQEHQAQLDKDADWVFERARNVLGYADGRREDTAGDYDRVEAAAQGVRGGTLTVPQALEEVDDILRERSAVAKAADEAARNEREAREEAARNEREKQEEAARNAREKQEEAERNERERMERAPDDARAAEEAARKKRDDALDLKSRVGKANQDFNTWLAVQQEDPGDAAKRAMRVQFLDIHKVDEATRRDAIASEFEALPKEQQTAERLAHIKSWYGVK